LAFHDTQSRLAPRNNPHAHAIQRRLTRSGYPFAGRSIAEGHCSAKASAGTRRPRSPTANSAPSARRQAVPASFRSLLCPHARHSRCRFRAPRSRTSPAKQRVDWQSVALAVEVERTDHTRAVGAHAAVHIDGGHPWRLCASPRRRGWRGSSGRASVRARARCAPQFTTSTLFSSKRRSRGMFSGG
jgi:hypothetical protein